MLRQVEAADAGEVLDRTPSHTLEHAGMESPAARPSVPEVTAVRRSGERKLAAGRARIGRGDLARAQVLLGEHPLPV